MVAEGVTLPPAAKPFVPAPVHTYESATGLQDAISVDDAPAFIVEGEAVSVHVGVVVGVCGDSVLQPTVKLPLESAVIVEYVHEFAVVPLKVIEPAKADPAASNSNAEVITILRVLINFEFILVSNE